MFFSAAKIVPYSELANWRDQLPDGRKPLVVTNGCFDLLHAGHVQTLEQARQFGASLLVGITPDDAVQRLKGSGRPLVPAIDRAKLIAALECVTAVAIFEELDAREFLSRGRPDLYVKGGDYGLESINQDERRFLESMGVPILFASAVEGRGTTDLISRIRRTAQAGSARSA